LIRVVWAAVGGTGAGGELAQLGALLVGSGKAAHRVLLALGWRVAC
jgi:hypothetical protein